MTNTYDLGDLVTVHGEITNPTSGAAVDPTAVVCIVTAPDGAETGYAYGLVSQGAWNAATNTPELSNAAGTAGHYYTVSAAGDVDFGNGETDFEAGDYAFFNGYEWKRLPGPSATAITKAGVGDYQLDVYASQVGEWWYAFEGCGKPTGKCRGRDLFYVQAE